MTSILSTRLWRLVPVIAAVMFVLSDSRPAMAMGCFVSLKHCYIRAAGSDSYFDSVLASLDCELDFAYCFRNEVCGW